MSVENNRCTLLCFYHERHWNSFTEKKEFSKINWTIFGFSMEIAIPAYFSFCIQFWKGRRLRWTFLLRWIVQLTFFSFLFSVIVWSWEGWKGILNPVLSVPLFFFFVFFSSKFCKKLVFYSFCFILMFENKTSKDSVRFVKVQYTTKYCLISFIFRVI